jgi:enamine deaminase RidA (YjgF/YER057c/UK114 family)
MGALVGLGDIKAHMQAAFDDMVAILREAGTPPCRIVKTTIFLTGRGHERSLCHDFTPLDQACSIDEIGWLPSGVLIETDCIAYAERKMP